ncbi:hypothetical protein HX001_00430 [Empedobacter brevis]|uniref:Signal peptidase n=1 Tax=Empedobacter brevis TaxID=247 RepID=A0AAJ1V6B0_9FLAO|nr:hypothetical protein [Empedobacter brevis]MDM1070952.1 hypothetical protein [Empedobacter brevis]
MNKRLKNIMWGGLFSILSFSNLFAAENQSDVSFFSENNTSSTNPGGHDSDDDPVDTTPIDSYTVVLFVLAIIAGYYGRNKLIKSNH